MALILRYLLILYGFLLIEETLALSEEEIVNRISEITESLSGSSDLRPDEFVGLIHEFFNLRSELNADCTNKYVGLSENIQHIKTILILRVGSIPGKYQQANNDNERYKLLQEFKDLRYVIDFNNLDPTATDIIRQLDETQFIFVSDKILEKYTGNVGETSEAGQGPNLSKLLAEYGDMQRKGILNNFMSNENYRLKIAEIDVIYSEAMINKVHSGLMNRGEMDSNLFENTVIALEDIVKLDSSLLRKLRLKDENIMRKYEELIHLESFNLSEAHCNDKYLEHIQEVQGYFQQDSRIRRFLEILETKQAEICRDFIEQQVRRLMREDIMVNSAMAWFNIFRLRVELVGQITAMERRELGYNLIHHLRFLGTDFNQVSDINEELLVRIDEAFQYFYGRYCNHIKPLFRRSYGFVLSAHEMMVLMPIFDRWTIEMENAMHVCNQIENTNGREWFLATYYELQEVRNAFDSNIQSSNIFNPLRAMEKVIYIAPALEKILGDTGWSSIVPTYQRIVEIWKKQLQEYSINDLKDLERFLRQFYTNAPIHRALDELLRTRISNILSVLRYNRNKRLQLRTDLREALNNLRSVVERHILKRFHPVIETRIIRVVRPGITKHEVESGLRELELGPSSSTSTAIPMTNIRKLTTKACGHIISLPRLKEIFDLYQAIQEIGFYRRFESDDVNFMVEFLICSKFPFPGESSETEAARTLYSLHDTHSE